LARRSDTSWAMWGQPCRLPFGCLRIES